MRKILFILAILLLSVNVTFATPTKRTYNRLIHSIAYIESRHNPNIVSTNGLYVGYLQISKVAVDECNRLIGYKKYNYRDRYDKDKSIEMFHIIQNYYNPNQDINLAIRIWNEGTSVINKKEKITPYMKEVLKLYNEKYSYIEE